MTTLRSSRRSFVASAILAVVVLGAFANQALAGPIANPTITVQASSSGYPAGIPVFTSATLGQGANPTGTIVFQLYGPADPTCAGVPMLVSQVAVAGNGYYVSASLITNLAGTYRWTARYTGDANNNPTATTACGDPAGAVSVAKRSPNLSSTAAVSSATITNSATLGSGAGPSGPTGTMTFKLYGAGNMTCAGSPILTSVKPVSGSGTYASDPFGPAAPGTYQWTVTYSGDANNNAAGTICTDPANAVTVVADSVVPPTTTVPVVTATASVRPGEQLTVSWTGIATPTAKDWLALYAVGAPDWSVLAWRYTTGGASGSVTITVPLATKPGSYEVRLFANNSVNRLDISDVVTVA